MLIDPWKSLRYISQREGAETTWFLHWADLGPVEQEQSMEPGKSCPKASVLVQKRTSKTLSTEFQTFVDSKEPGDYQDRRFTKDVR